MQDPLNISHDVTSALNRSEPVVALESSVIAQGLPSPVNVETALAMEENIRSAGATPATIGIIDGKIRVGLTKEEIERLGEGDVSKIAIRDLPYAVSKNLSGGTTVSATARIAAAAGIAVMSTGGIGGVHRGFSQTCDISADLWELTRTPILVVCSGPKAVLDIPATMEWLETHSMPLYGYGTEELPVFYSKASYITIPKLDDAADVAKVARFTGGMLGMRNAMIVAIPVPKEYEIDVSSQLVQAIQEATENGIRGKDVTPYLLGRLAEMTGGKTIDSNIALLKNNATIAAEIANALLDDAQRRMGFIV